MQTPHDGRTRGPTADGHEDDAVHDGRPRRRREAGRAAGPAGLVAGGHVAGRRARRCGRVRGGPATAAGTLRAVAAAGRLADVLNDGRHRKSLRKRTEATTAYPVTDARGTTVYRVCRPRRRREFSGNATVSDARASS